MKNCKSCVHEPVCKYAGNFDSIQTDINNLFENTYTDGLREFFKPPTVECSKYLAISGTRENKIIGSSGIPAQVC